LIFFYAPDLFFSLTAAFIGFFFKSITDFLLKAKIEFEGDIPSPFYGLPEGSIPIFFLN